MKHINTIRRAVALVAVVIVTMASAMAQTAVNYIDKDGIEQTCETYIEVGTTTTAWNAGWYLVNGEVVIGGGAGIGGGADGTAYNIEINRGTVTANGSLLSTGIGMGATTAQKKYSFTVAENKTVEFSPGNLQYIGSVETPYWKFADHQWDCLGNTGQGSTSENVDRDLFGWGCTGFVDTRGTGRTWYQTKYMPYSTSTSVVNTRYNNFGYGPDCISDPYYNLTVVNKSDWGYNTIYAGVTATTGWRTLTSAEWGCLLNTRSASMINGVANARYALVKVNDVCGMMVFPDVFEWPSAVSAKPTTFNIKNDTWNNVNYTVSEFGALESAGAVFLPAAGLRDGTTVSAVGSRGLYWSSSYTTDSYNKSAYARDMDFSSSGVYTQGGNNRYFGFSVRLVREQKTATLTLSNGDNTVAEALGVAWNEDDVVNVYNGETNVGSLSYRNYDGNTATFTGYINEGIDEGTQLTFRRGTTPAFTEQDGALATLQANYSLEGTATYNAAGIYNNISMGVPYALMKLDLSAFGTADGTTVTISAGSPSATVASVTGVTTSSKELYLAMPANGVETEYTFCGNSYYAYKTCALAANTFYTKEGSGTGEAIVVKPDAVDFGAASGLLWSVCNLGATNGATPESWYGDYYAWTATTTWYEAGYAQENPQKHWAKHYENGYCVETCPYMFGNLEEGGFDKYNSEDGITVLEASDDAAHAVWGGTWRMPTATEWQVLYNNNTFEWLNANATSTYVTSFTAVAAGYLVVKGKLPNIDNTKYIFLPAAGVRNGTDLTGMGLSGNYWSSSLNSSNIYDSFFMGFYSKGVNPQISDKRLYGLSVRPVR